MVTASPSPVATTPSAVRRQARAATTLGELDTRIEDCRACPRLVAWRQEVARTKRASYVEETYWGRPVAGFGSATAGVLIIGLAPAAHGANRTGRVFTGDRSGDWLFASLHRVGLASQATSTSTDDGLRLPQTRILAAVRCAPPQNRPTTQERDTCAPWVEAELAMLDTHLRVVVALGRFGWDAALTSLAAAGWEAPLSKQRFGHGVEAVLTRADRTLTLLGSYHPSQQNTFTGRLTAPMLDAVLSRAEALGVPR